MGIQEEYLPLLNKSTTDYDWHYLPPEMGGGIQAYVEGFHYIHCLVSNIRRTPSVSTLLYQQELT